MDITCIISHNGSLRSCYPSLILKCSFMKESWFLQFIGIDKREASLKSYVSLQGRRVPGSMFKLCADKTDIGNGTVLAACKFHESGEMGNHCITRSPVSNIFRTGEIVDTTAGVFLPEFTRFIEQLTTILQESSTTAFLSVDNRLWPGM